MILTLEIVGHQSGLPGFSGGKQFGPNGGTIGRLPDNDWVLPDPYISGRHALIRYVGGKFYIEDISTNGVFHNAPDNRLQRSRPQLLEEGDRLYIDEYEIGVRFVNQEPVAPPQPQPAPQVQPQPQQRPFSPAASTVAVPVMAPQPVSRPQPPPIARPQPQPQVQPLGTGVSPVTMQMPVAPAPVPSPPSVEPAMVARPSAPPPTRPVPRRIAAPDNDLRLLGLDDRQAPPSPAPVARVPDLLEMGRPNAVSPPSSFGYPRNADLISASPQPFPAQPDPSFIPDPNEQDDLSLAPVREALSVAPAPSSLPPPMVPRPTGMNGSTGYRPLGASQSGNNAGAKLGASGATELARKPSTGAADATLAYPPSAPQNPSASQNKGASSVIIPDDYDPLEDDIGTIAAPEPVTGMAAAPPAVPTSPTPPTNGAYSNGRMTMAQPPIATPRRPVPPGLPPKPDMAPPVPRAGSPVPTPRVPSPPIVAAPSQQAVPQAQQNAPTAASQVPVPTAGKAPTPVAPQPNAAPPPPSIPMPMPGPAVRVSAPQSTPAGVASRPMNGAAPRTEEPSRPMIPPPAVPRPMRPAVVPYPGRKPAGPTATNSVATAPQAQPAAASVPAPAAATASATPRPQAVVAPSPADAGAIAAVLESAGLQLTDVPPEFSQNLGKILRVAVTGMIEVLRAQQSIKDEFRMRMTAFKNVDNNPLKLSGSPEEALQSLFAGQSGTLPVEAFEEAFREVRNHELAMLDGMRVAYEFMLAEFDPDRVQEDFNSSSSRGSILGKSAKSRYWDFYREKYGEIISDGEASFRNRFGDEFAKAYEEQLERLNALDRNRGK